MDTQTIDQEYEKLQAEFQDVATTVKALADKLQTASKAGDANATAWLEDLELIAKDIDEEQTQAKVLLLAIHRFISSAAQSQSGDVESADKQPLYAPGHEPQQAPQQQPQTYVRQGGMFGGGMMGGPMMGGYMGGGFARSMEMGMGMSLGASLISSIFR
ncbi:MAG TPA: hypothetical protein VGL76_01995 [Gaiellaceae bacterium]|jgi:hypothetical protein